MIGDPRTEVKPFPKPVTFVVGDPDDRLSLAHALRTGYALTLDGDGCAEVLKADGTAYHVVGWRCDCPDAQGRDGGSYGVIGRRACKHVIWISQLYPCQYCGAAMPLTEHRTAFGSLSRTYDCPACGNAYDYRFVRGKRRQVRLREKEAGHVA